MAKLIDYYSDTCDICAKVAPLLDRLKKEEKVKVERKEVSKNEHNAHKMQEVAQKTGCIALPVILNPGTGKVICGHAANDYAALKKLAKNKAK